MPYLSIQTNLALTDNQSRELLENASRTVATMLGKPESYVMIAIHAANPIMFAGSTDPAAYLELKSLGLPETATADFSRTLCDLIGSELGVAAERTYIEFAGPKRQMWGWNNETF